MNNKQIKIGAIISYVSIFVNIFVGLLYTPWMVKQIGKSQYGLYTLANSLITMFLVDFGLSSATARYVSNYHAEDNQDKVNNFLGVIYKLYGVIDFAIFIVLTILFIFIEKIYVNLTLEELHQFKIVYVIAACYSLINFPFLTLNGILTAYEKFIQLKLADLIYRILLVGLMVLALSFGFGLYALVTVNAIAGLIVILYKYIVIKIKTPIQVNLKYKDSKLFKEIFNFSIWVTVMAFASRLIFTISPSILGVVANSSEIAIFGIVATIEGYIYTITTAINGMFMPTISKAYADDRDNLSKNIMPLFVNVGKFNMAVNSLLVIGFAVVGKEFVILWMGENYLNAYYGILLVILPGLFFNSLQVANTAILVENKVKYQAIISVVIGIVNVGLSFYLSSIYGAIGAAISICVAYIIRFILYVIVHKRIMKFDMWSFTKKCYFRMIPCVVLPLLFGFLFNYLLPSGTWLYLFIKVVLIVVIFVLSLFLCVNKDEIKQIFFKFKGRN